MVVGLELTSVFKPPTPVGVPEIVVGGPAAETSPAIDMEMNHIKKEQRIWMPRERSRVGLLNVTVRLMIHPPYV
jgi:hypothetical protein